MRLGERSPAPGLGENPQVSADGHGELALQRTALFAKQKFFQEGEFFTCLFAFYSPKIVLDRSGE
jgi:hypothetical protein